MNSYEYPPSKFILRYEPFETNSQYYVKGYCIFEGKRYQCNFEIAYALTGEIYIVSYMSFDNKHAIFSFSSSTEPRMYSPKPTRVQVDFEGVEQKYGGKIKVKNAVSLTNGMNSFLAESTPPIFVANSYTISNRNENHSNNDETSFDLTNIIDQSESTISYDIGRSKPLMLKLTSVSANASTGQNSMLIVPKECVPKGWTADDVAELWCSLVSLASGSDIRWFIKNYSTKRSIMQTFIRRRNIVRNLATYGMIEIMRPFWYDVEVKKFITAAFSGMKNKNITVKAARDYARIMTHFVEYRLITNRVQDQARLISTTVEELLTRWEEHTKNIPTSAVSPLQAEGLWENLQKDWLPNLGNFIESSSKDQIDAIKNRLRNFFNEDLLRPGFEKRLKKLFKSGKNDTAWFNRHVKSRLNPFVTTRNKIAHEGRFPSEDSYELFDYYFNMLMILPLMIFSIFGYSGVFTDLSENHRRLNSKKSVTQNTSETD